MKLILVLFLNFFSLSSFCQSGSTAKDGCLPFQTKYTDPDDDFAVCLPKTYKVTPSEDGVSFSDGKNVENEIVVLKQSNERLTSLKDWGSIIEKSQSNGTTVPTFETRYFLGTDGNAPRSEIGQRITGTNADGSKINIILVPLNKNNTKVLVVLFITHPELKELKDIQFNYDTDLILRSFTRFPEDAGDVGEKFFSELSILVSKANKKQLSSLKENLIKTESDGSKTYSCTLELQGFKLTISESATKTSVEGIAISTPDMDTKMTMLLDNNARLKNGLGTFITADYKATHEAASGIFETATELSKVGSGVKIIVFKFMGNAAYALTITQ
ncbi:MAG: hypothetical protein ABIT96_08830 [Ferruginibacter sp.]